MMRCAWTLMVPVMLAMGCSQSLEPTGGTSMPLGAVAYNDAFVAAQQVMDKHFTLKSSDPQSGRIVAQPKAVDAQSERIVTRLAGGAGSPARQLASLSLHRRGGRIEAHAVVEIQRQHSEIHRTHLRDEENYDGVPNKTPADVDAATTLEQRETWQTMSYDRALEWEILQAIHRRLHPAAEK